MTQTWTSWGDSQPELTRRMRGLLRAQIGPTSPAPAAPIGAARVAASALPPTTLDKLRHALGPDAVLVDDETRARHAGGQAYADIMRRRQGDASEAPDAVLLPSDAAGVQDVLRICTDDRVAVVPWGGGTSVVG